MPRSFILGEFEHLVLLVIMQLGNDCHALELRERLSDVIGHEITRGALYRTLDRLGEKGYLVWTLEEGGPSRGGHPRRRFEVTAAGIEALRDARSVFLEMWDGLGEALQ